MAKRFAAIIIPLLFMLLFFNGCKKFEKQGGIPAPGIALTFDDNYIDDWFEYLPFLDSAGVKATFYISRYNRLSPQQKNKLAVIQGHGNEIAFHSTNHYNMMDYVYKQKHTIDELMKCEIEDGLKLMNRDGFFPITFAYPMGAHNGLLDKRLKRYFKSVRALNGTADFSKSLVPTEKNEVLYGLGIDKSSKRSDADVIQVIQSASDNNDCAVLVAHHINTNAKMSVTHERLLKIFSLVKKLGMKYYTVAEISE